MKIMSKKDFLTVRECMDPNQMLRLLGKESNVVKCHAGHILFSYEGEFPDNLVIRKKCKSCKKYYEISKG